MDSFSIALLPIAASGVYAAGEASGGGSGFEGVEMVFDTSGDGMAGLTWWGLMKAAAGGAVSTGTALLIHGRRRLVVACPWSAKNQKIQL